MNYRDAYYAGDPGEVLAALPMGPALPADHPAVLATMFAAPLPSPRPPGYPRAQGGGLPSRPPVAPEPPAGGHQPPCPECGVSDPCPGCTGCECTCSCWVPFTWAAFRATVLDPTTPPEGDPS